MHKQPQSALLCASYLPVEPQIWTIKTTTSATINHYQHNHNESAGTLFVFVLREIDITLKTVGMEHSYWPVNALQTKVLFFLDVETNLFKNSLKKMKDADM